MEYQKLLTELQHNDIVCRCNQVTAGDLLEVSKFNQDKPTDEILKLAKCGVSCGICLDKEKGKLKDKYETYYKDVLRIK